MAWLLALTGIGLAFVGISAPPGPPRLLVLGGLLVLALGLAAGAGYQIVARSSRPPTAYRGPSPVLLFFLVVVFVNLLGAIVAIVTGGGTDALDVERPDVFLVGLLIQIAGYLGAIALFVVAPRVLTWRELTNSADKSLRQLLGDVSAAAGVILPVTIVALILGSLAALVLDARPPQVVPLPETALELVLVALAAVVLAPIGEELFFRGFALTAWWRDLGERSALVRSSLFFALVHVLNVQVELGDASAGLRQAAVLLVVLLPVGFVLGWLFVRRGLAASITAHMTYNGIVFGLLLLSTMLPLPAG